jgi:hypothetical protein
VPALLVGVVLGVAAVVAVKSREPAAIVTLLGGAVIWTFIDGPVEGPVLMRLSASHGVHAGDLPAFAAAAVAFVAARRQWRTRESAQ